MILNKILLHLVIIYGKIYITELRFNGVHYSIFQNIFVSDYNKERH